MPLVKQTWLCKKKGQYVAMRMVASVGEKRVRFEVVAARTEADLCFDPAGFSKGGNATCLFCGTVADSDYVQAQGMQRQVGSQLLAVVCRRPQRSGGELKKGKIYARQASILLENNSCRSGHDQLPTAKAFFALARARGGI
jgi:putative DNA methylase